MTKLLDCLQEKYAGRLTKQTVISLAECDKHFAFQWFVHTIRSDSSQDEQILASAFALYWQMITLEQLARNTKPSESFIDEHSLANVIEVSSLLKANINVEELKAFMSYVAAIVDWQGDINRYSGIAKTAMTELPEQLFSSVKQQVEPELKDVTLLGKEGVGSRDASIRNNSNFYTPLPNTSLELAIMERMTANVVGQSIAYAEPPVVLRYLPGQYYHWHYDHIYPHNEQIAAQIAHFGQRVKTGILNLNDDFIGGQTEFKLDKLSLEPKLGQVIAFDNVDIQGNREKRSIHRGKEVERGEKWIMTLWFRDKPFWLRSALF